MDVPSEALWLGRLLEFGRTLVTELDLGVVLDRVLETAREITGARYAAVGILDERRTELDQFLTSGVEEDERRAIGELPRGRGVLGVLIEHPETLRLKDVSAHPRSYGFPAGHPVMRSFLGAPVVIRGQAWGNLYLAEKEGGDEFDERDERAAAILAEWAGVAIHNARLYETSEQRRHELEKAVRGLEATRDVTVAIGGETSLEHTLELIAKRGRALVGARSLVILLRDGEELVVHASAGHARNRHGTRLPIAESTSGQVLERRLPERIVDVSSRMRIAAEELGVDGAQTALLVPMHYRGDRVGVLAAFDHGEGGSLFSSDDEQMLRTFAASAATAVALAQSVQADRLRSSLAAAEAERRRWARELHDETLQALGGLRVLLSTALRREDPETTVAAMRDAVGWIGVEIENLRSIITELRPAALDELGLRVAIDTLIDRHIERSDLTIERELTIEAPAAGAEQLDEDLETTVYRFVQEALTNVSKHARAHRVLVSVKEAKGEITVEVRDDGTGFDPRAVGVGGGFGLGGLEERVSLAGGVLSIESGEDGTLLSARLPARHGHRGERSAWSRADQAAS